ncbi:Truncated disease resistance protein [Trichuris trichiura]|uniref:Truncated disease resistance protein n=1 Tax=Trichuris trichiura TaxID=36087 RepID=A0A077ZJW2_TRITR|nr:Truncated disease resistance protein [Trichuris trichiura]
MLRSWVMVISTIPAYRVIYGIIFKIHLRLSMSSKNIYSLMVHYLLFLNNNYSCRNPIKNSTFLKFITITIYVGVHPDKPALSAYIFTVEQYTL